MEIQKQKFHQHQETFLIKNIDIIKIMQHPIRSQKGFKFFIAYKNS